MGFLFTHFAFFDSMSLRLVTTLSRGLNLGAHPTAQTEKPLKWFHVHHWDSVNGLKLAVNEKLEVRPTFRLLRQSPAEKRTILSLGSRPTNSRALHWKQSLESVQLVEAVANRGERCRALPPSRPSESFQ